MTKEELTTFIKENCFTCDGRLKSKCNNMFWWRNYNLFLSELISLTNYLNNNSSILDKIFFFHYNIEIKHCKLCLKELNTRYFYSKDGLISSNFCSKKCHKMWLKDEKSYNEKQNMVLKVKQTKLEKYGDENYNNPEKYKQTHLEKYGVEHNSHIPEVIEKRKITRNIDKDIKDKIANEKSKQTCLEKYGVENPQQVSEIKQKTKDTCLKKYGKDTYLHSEDYESKIHEISFKKYGTFNYQQSEIIIKKSKETQFKNHGVWYLSTEKSKIIRIQTCLEKYGEEHHMRNPCILNIVLKQRYKFKDYILPSGKLIKLQGYEPKALNDLLKLYNETEIIYEKTLIPKIYYSLNDKTHKYFPDFYIPKENLIIEVKSEYTLNADIDKNRAKFNATLALGYNLKLIIFD